MSSKENLFIKLGVSEHKRNNLVGSYYSFLWLAKYIADLKIKKNQLTNHKEEILNKMFNLRILFINKKKDININREISFMQTKLFLFDNSNKIFFELSNRTKNILEYEENYIPKDFFSFSKEEYIFFEIILRQIKRNFLVFPFLLEKLKNNKNLYNTNLIKDPDLDEKIKNIKSKKDLFNLIKLKSGEPKTNPNYESNKLNKENIINYFLEYYFNPSSYIIQKILHNLSALLLRSNTNKPYYLFFLIFGEKFSLRSYKNKIQKLLLNLNNNNLKTLEKLITNERNNLNKNIQLRILEGSKKDYINLVKKHFNSLPGLILHEKNNLFNLTIEKDYLILYERIINNKEILYDFIKNHQDDFLTPKKLKELLKISTTDIPEQNEEKIFFDMWNNYYDKNEIKKMLNLNFSNKKEISFFFQNNNHFKTPIETPLLYEWAIGLSIFYSKFNKEIKEKNTLLIDKFRKILSIKMDSKFRPFWYASGVADISVKHNSEEIIIEPTLVDYRTEKHEMGALYRLRDSEIFSKAYIITPSPSENSLRFYKAINNGNYFNKNKKIFLLSTQQFKETFLLSTF